ncbi:perforin-1-like [Centroberyx affinis]|uniref:perforin-1-like n=1 Tax=Centroberyx affinis TaxID=166261 RepID=UPI003A5BAF22
MKLAVIVTLLVIVLVQAQTVNGWSRRSARVMVDCARDLRGDGWWGKTDGYVKVRIGWSSRTTRVVKNNNNPTWRQTLYFSHVYSSSMRVEVWDKDSGWFNRDDHLGTCFIRMVRGAKNRMVTCRLRRGWARLYYTY